MGQHTGVRPAVRGQFRREPGRRLAASLHLPSAGPGRPGLRSGGPSAVLCDRYSPGAGRGREAREEAEAAPASMETEDQLVSEGRGKLGGVWCQVSGMVGLELVWAVGVGGYGTLSQFENS